LKPQASFINSGDIMHLIAIVIIGFLAGLLARVITPGAGPHGFWLTSALGIGGSLAATYLGHLLGWIRRRGGRCRCVVAHLSPRPQELSGRALRTASISGSSA
jgi:uncharacterized membrane protein YeaQ/YmgE (transglycosylase-associated protein family)